MAEKVRSQIMLEADKYRWLLEEQSGRHHKNLSITINEILRNYQIMIRSVDQARKHAEKLEIAKKEADKLVKNYRDQVVLY